MTVISIPGTSPALRLAWLLLAGLLIVALGSGAALVGSALLTSTRTDDARRSTAVIPQGSEALIAFGTLDDGPDGQKAGDIYTVRADGTELRQLTDGPEWEADPAWSPDGTRIAFRSWDSGTDGVVVMDADGGNRMTLASSEQSSQDCLARTRLEWAPDASSIIFPTRTSCTGPYDLQIVAADGSSSAKPLLAESFDSRFATWSPDGLHIAFLGRTADGPSVGLYTAATNPTQAIEEPTSGRRIGPDLGTRSRRCAHSAALVPRWIGAARGHRLAALRRAPQPRGGGRWLGTAPDHRERDQPILVTRRTTARVPAAGGAVGAVRQPAVHDAHVAGRRGRLERAGARGAW